MESIRKVFILILVGILMFGIQIRNLIGAKIIIVISYVFLKFIVKNTDSNAVQSQCSQLL